MHGMKSVMKKKQKSVSVIIKQIHETGLFLHAGIQNRMVRKLDGLTNMINPCYYKGEMFLHDIILY